MYVFLAIILVLSIVWLVVPSFQLFIQDRTGRWADFFSDRAYEIPTSMGQNPESPASHYRRWGSVNEDGPEKSIPNHCFWKDGKLECN